MNSDLLATVSVVGQYEKLEVRLNLIDGSNKGDFQKVLLETLCISFCLDYFHI